MNLVQGIRQVGRSLADVRKLKGGETELYLAMITRFLILVGCLRQYRGIRQFSFREPTAKVRKSGGMVCRTLSYTPPPVGYGRGGALLGAIWSHGGQPKR